PIVERQAPKDTLEAAQNAYLPDTLVQNPAFVRWEIEGGISFILCQDKKTSLKDYWYGLKFSTHQSWICLRRNSWQFLTLKSPDYSPHIHVGLPVRDLRSIYRALPQNARIILFFSNIEGSTQLSNKK